MGLPHPVLHRQLLPPEQARLPGDRASDRVQDHFLKIGVQPMIKHRARMLLPTIVALAACTVATPVVAQAAVTTPRAATAARSAAAAAPAPPRSLAPGGDRIRPNDNWWICLGIQCDQT